MEKQKKQVLDCRTAEGMVGRYLNHTLSAEELESFLDHVESCPSCYDELETGFIVKEALQKLDADDSEENLDFRKLLNEDLEHSRKQVQGRRMLRMVWAVVVFAAIGALLVLLLFVIIKVREIL